MPNRGLKRRARLRRPCASGRRGPARAQESAPCRSPTCVKSARRAREAVSRPTHVAEQPPRTRRASASPAHAVRCRRRNLSTNASRSPRRPHQHDEARALARPTSAPADDRAQPRDGVVPADSFDAARASPSHGQPHARSISSKRTRTRYTCASKLSRAFLRRTLADEDPATPHVRARRATVDCAPRPARAASASTAELSAGERPTSSPSRTRPVDARRLPKTSPAIVFSLSRAAVRDTIVGGRLVVEQNRHPAQDEIVSRFNALQRRLWS